MEAEHAAAVVSPAPPQAVWDVLLDGRRWNEWNPGVEWMVVEDRLAPGALITMKPKGAPQTAFTIEDVAPPNRLALRLTFGPLATMRFRWAVTPVPEGTRIEQTVAISGIAAGLLLKKATRRIVEAMPATLERLARRARPS